MKALDITSDRARPPARGIVRATRLDLIGARTALRDERADLAAAADAAFAAAPSAFGRGHGPLARRPGRAP